MKRNQLPPFRLVLTLLALLLTTLHGIARGQESSQRRQEPIRVEVEAVNLLVSVTDKNGRFIVDLPKSRFRVIENGERQEIVNFSQQTELPLRIALLIDTSASVRTKLDFEKRASTNFLFAVMRPKDQALLVEFDSGVSLVSDFTDKPSEIVNKLKSLRAGGGTALLDAVHDVSLQKMVGPGVRQAMVIVSDGADLNSSRSVKEAVEACQRSGVTVYGIGTTRFGASGDKDGEEMLNRLAENTGGRAFFPYSPDTLSEAFELINQELRSQYSLTYTPKKKRAEGKFRKIEVKLQDDKGLTLRYRRGYYEPGPR